MLSRNQIHHAQQSRVQILRRRRPRVQPDPARAFRLFMARQAGPYQGLQLAVVNRLGYKVDAGWQATSVRHLLRAQHRHHDYFEFFIPRARALECSKHLKAIHAWHVQIGDHQVRACFANAQ